MTRTAGGGRSRFRTTTKATPRSPTSSKEPLPPGHYFVELPEQGGLTDLAGLSPVAEGQRPGTLAQFDVTPPSPPRDPFDYGALLPDRASSGVRFEGTLRAGRTRRITVS